MKYLSRIWFPIKRFLPWLVFGILIVYTYATFFQVPYMGFDFNPSIGQIVDVFVEAVPGGSLQPGDRLIQIGSLTWDNFRADSRETLFDGVEVGQVVPLIVQRNAQMHTIQWVFPGPNPPEILARLVNLWGLGYVFWLAGTAAYLFVRPIDTRCLLFIIFNYLTAIWLVSGNMSRWQVWESAIMMRSVIWLCVPVYLHLHWVFPKPLRRLPVPILLVVYLTFIILAVVEWLTVLPRNAFFLGFLLSVTGSAVLLLFHFIRHPTQRREVGTLITAVVLATLPSAAVGVAGLFGAIPRLGGGALLALPIIPGAYFYAIHRGRLGGLELRANRLISSYMFFILLGSVIVVIVSLADLWLYFPGAIIIISVSAAVLAGIITAFGFPSFQRLVEHHLLGMPLPPTRLLEAYITRITTSLGASSLLRLLRDEILPSLLVRQSALLQRKDDSRFEVLYTSGIEDAELPTDSDIHDLIAQAGIYRFTTSASGSLQPCPWVRLVLPLKIGGKLIGLWLLGSRDPDNYYPLSEIPTFRMLADQTAIALTNIIQAEQLRSLYQANIERQESERANLALVLHDEVLNQLAVLSMYMDQSTHTQGFHETYHSLTESIRQTILWLRPAMLTYGLRAALEELVDELSDRAGDVMSIQIDLPPTEARYIPQAEGHLFRIVQQACENTLRHAHASTIRIHGQVEPEQVILVVEDDGVGFPAEEQLNIAKLLADKHFGLVGMHERATIIGAEMQIYSAPRSGTRISVIWNPKDYRP